MYSTVSDCIAIFMFAFLGLYLVSWFFDTELHKKLKSDLTPVMIAMAIVYSFVMLLAAIFVLFVDKPFPFGELRLIMNTIIMVVLGTILTVMGSIKYIEKLTNWVDDKRRNLIKKRRAR